MLHLAFDMHKVNRYEFSLNLFYKKTLAQYASRQCYSEEFYWIRNTSYTHHRVYELRRPARGEARKVVPRQGDLKNNFKRNQYFFSNCTGKPYYLREVLKRGQQPLWKVWDGVPLHVELLQGRAVGQGARDGGGRQTVVPAKENIRRKLFSGVRCIH